MSGASPVSHSKGFLAGKCEGNLAPYGKVRDGIQQYKCPRCGQMDQKQASRCLMFHSWHNKGRPNDGYQKQTCNRCGHKRVTQRRPCFMFHSYHRTRDNPVLRCKTCGTPKEA